LLPNSKFEKYFIKKTFPLTVKITVEFGKKDGGTNRLNQYLFHKPPMIGEALGNFINVKRQKFVQRT
jgi:hypothetical protein